MGVYGQIRNSSFYQNQMNIEPVHKQIVVNGKRVNIFLRYPGSALREYVFILQELCRFLCYQYDILRPPRSPSATSHSR